MNNKMPIAVVGAGIVGATTAFYLSAAGYAVTIYDEGTGQATSAAAGIICPWLSQRRNKQWYQLAAAGAAFYPTLMQDLNEDMMNSDIYRQVGTLVFKKSPELLAKLEKIALKRRETAPEIGELSILSPAEIKAKLPLLETEQSALFASGGARVDGSLLTKKLVEAAVSNGADYFPEKAQLTMSTTGTYTIATPTHTKHFSAVVLAAGAWLPEILQPLGFSVDIRPQKGQLIHLEVEEETQDWPVVMPDGEKDIIPFPNGRIVVGATHENDEGYDLVPSEEKLAVMLNEAAELAPSLAKATIKEARVGTRAFTSDFAPFFGEVPESPGLYVASGLGSSGLTSGPIIARMLTQLIMDKPTDLPVFDYPVARYIHRTHSYTEIKD
ncbi:FAD-binding oxidoreductase [Carnobacterium sp. CS13]|uniref:NAD(P)/FAD-dependent oxidoreductase n=1 Tax=Carnobacterium sp. CS13 TaxID=2800128 RepID=UPI001912B586|nr:FAD-dependent oxidoreductase [Carnobacterium sp. CS13]QQP70457.1 FAD-binding oxidoreductase [Carnobacterium sp. CS13]